MPTYKDLYEELQEAISAAITMLQQIQQDTKNIRSPRKRSCLQMLPLFTLAGLKTRVCVEQV